MDRSDVSGKPMVTLWHFGLVSLMVCLIGNCLVPPLVSDVWVRDSDVGLWFCGGLFLSQLSVPGWLSLWRVGSSEHRLLLAAAMTLCCIGSGWIGFLISGPASRDDAIAFMVSVFVPPIVFWGVDSWAGWISGFSLVHMPCFAGLGVGNEQQEPRTSKMGAVVQGGAARVDGGENADGAACEKDQGGDGFRFRLRSLFAWITLVAIGVALWKSAATMNAIAFRDIRGFLMEPLIYTLVRLLFLVAVHGLVVIATLKPKARWAWWVLIAGFAGGLEGIRRNFSGFSSTVGYLEWDFAMLSLGFLVGQILLGLAIRWMGWVGVGERG
ncbi:MAG: hypothetical protein ACK5PZ_20235 [Pirellula sp.]